MMNKRKVRSIRPGHGEYLVEFGPVGTLLDICREIRRNKARIISRISGFTYVRTKFDYNTEKRIF